MDINRYNHLIKRKDRSVIMTCILGYISKEDNCIYIGGDSAGVSGLNIRLREDKKVFVRLINVDINPGKGVLQMGIGFTTHFVWVKY